MATASAAVALRVSPLHLTGKSRPPARLRRHRPPIRFRARNQEVYPSVRPRARARRGSLAPAILQTTASPRALGSLSDHHHTMAARHMGEGEGADPKQDSDDDDDKRAEASGLAAAAQPRNRFNVRRLFPRPGSRTPQVVSARRARRRASSARACISRAPGAARLTKQPSVKRS